MVIAPQMDLTPNETGGDSMDEVSNWQIFAWLWGQRDWITARVKELTEWFRSSKPVEGKAGPGILILGPGGTGKSTLAQLLSGKLNPLLDLPGDYKESLDIEKFPLKDDPGVGVVVPPGQSHRREATWTGQLKGLVEGDYRGVIVMNSYGYHSLGEISYTQTKSFLEKGQDGFLPAYLEDRRQDELNVLKRLAEAIRLTKHRLWVLYLVSKQDLWCNDSTSSEAHYRDGEYGAIIHELQNLRGHDQFRHEYVFGSIVISNFQTGRGEKLKSNTEGYDQQLQVRSIRRLLETLGSFQNWEDTNG